MANYLALDNYRVINQDHVVKVFNRFNEKQEPVELVIVMIGNIMEVYKSNKTAVEFFQYASKESKI